MSRIVAITNQKGGVGKTTTAVNLATTLAMRGLHVLLVDLDPQGNASSAVGLPRAEAEGGSFDLLLGEAKLDDVARTTDVPNLELIPASEALLGAEVELVGVMGRERRLEAALEPARERYDWVVLDCPPSLGLLTVNALTAADGILIPLQAEYFAMEGLVSLLETWKSVRRWLNPRLARDGILLTLFDGRTNLAREVEAEVRAAFGAEVLQTMIPRSVKLGEAPSHGRPIALYAPHSPGARAYLELGDELLARQQAGAAAVAS
ncbi:MAG: ParA family protein [Deltaproteobacteria bacterium]|nr:ParA family protein [Deltaproteobacteria bacterium]